MTINWELLGQPDMIARLCLQLALFAGSALFSMSETTLFSLRESDLEELEDTGHPRAGHLRSLLLEPRKLIVSILCGNELINIAATINLAGILLQFLGSPQAAGLVNTLIMLPLLLIFCEITPKTLAVSHPVALATRLIEPVITVWVRLVAPVQSLVRLSSDRITTLIVGEAREERNLLSADEFEEFLRDVEQEGAVTAAERRAIINLIEAGSTRISQIMVPRTRVEFIPVETPIGEAIERFRLLRHRRVPVYQGRRDEVVGMLKDDTVWELACDGAPDGLTVAELMEPAHFVPDTQTVTDLAEFFKEGDHHAVIVVNEFGGVEGLVSADDVFGYLMQGHAIFLEDHAEIFEVEPGVWRCAGLASIDVCRRRTNLALEEDFGVSTVGGLVMALLRRVPETGDTVHDAGMVFRVEAMDGLMVDEILIAPPGHPLLESGVAAAGGAA